MWILNTDAGFSSRDALLYNIILNQRAFSQNGASCHFHGQLVPLFLIIGSGNRHEDGQDAKMLSRRDAKPAIRSAFLDDEACLLQKSSNYMCTLRALYYLHSYERINKAILRSSARVARAFSLEHSDLNKRDLSFPMISVRCRVSVAVGVSRCLRGNA